MDGFDRAIAALVAACVLALGWGCYWFATHNGGCAKGTHSVITGWYPMLIGKVVVMEPMTSCEAN